jgi:hypothetical protein
VSSAKVVRAAEEVASEIEAVYVFGHMVRSLPPMLSVNPEKALPVEGYNVSGSQTLTAMSATVVAVTTADAQLIVVVKIKLLGAVSEL